MNNVENLKIMLDVYSISYYNYFMCIVCSRLSHVVQHVLKLCYYVNVKTVIPYDAVLAAI